MKLIDRSMCKKALELQDVMSPYAQVMAAKPGLFPKAMTGALPTTVMHALLGTALGRYVASPILSRLYPEMDEDRLRTVSTLGGGMLGALPGLAMMHSTYRGAGNSTKGWFNGLEGMSKPMPAEGWVNARQRELKGMQQRGEYDPTVDSNQVLVKGSSFPGLQTRKAVSPMWNAPSIPVGISQSTIDTAVYNGTMDPFQAAAMSQMISDANSNRSRGLISPAGLARAAVQYGIGNLAARSLAAVSNATFHNFSPGEQKNLARGAGIGNMLFGMMGDLIQ